MSEFIITYQGKTFGYASVKEEGLYYAIHCKCAKKEVMCKILATGTLGSVDLGICIPVENEMEIRTKVAVKRLGEIQSFELEKKNNHLHRITLEKGIPIPAVAILTDSRLIINEGKTMLETKLFHNCNQILNS